MEKDTGNGSFNTDMIILALHVGQKHDTEPDLKMSLALQQAQKVDIGRKSRGKFSYSEHFIHIEVNS